MLYGRLLATADELATNCRDKRPDRNDRVDDGEGHATDVKVRYLLSNVRIKIGTFIFDCTTEYQSAVFYEEDGKIKVNVYDNKT
jgi:uncharacterized protein (DUF342 family)